MGDAITNVFFTSEFFQTDLESEIDKKNGKCCVHGSKYSIVQLFLHSYNSSIFAGHRNVMLTDWT